MARMMKLSGSPGPLNKTNNDQDDLAVAVAVLSGLRAIFVAGSVGVGHAVAYQPSASGVADRVVELPCLVVGLSAASACDSLSFSRSSSVSM